MNPVKTKAGKSELDPRVVLSVGVSLLIILSITVAVMSMKTTKVTGSRQAYYSVDDGKTWFAENDGKIVPFDYNGREAVRAHVYRCGKGKPFVGFLHKFSDQARKRLEAFRNDPANAGRRPPPDIMNQMLVKKPGGEWVPESDRRRAGDIKNVRGPNGEDAVEVFPE
jgi:hypothetical protein